MGAMRGEANERQGVSTKQLEVVMEIDMENPAFAESGAAISVALLEEREAKLRREFDEKLAAAVRDTSTVDADGTTAGAPLESAVRSFVAKLGEAPTNWHQCTVFHAASPEPHTSGHARRGFCWVGR